MPFGSRVMPWVCAVRPCGPGTANSLTSPVLVAIRPIVIRLFGMLQVNQRSPCRSSQASCTPQPGIITDGVPSDQSHRFGMARLDGDGRMLSLVETKAKLGGTS